jgi:hypothetical protein
MTEEICLICYEKKDDNGLVLCSSCNNRIKETDKGKR